MDHPLRRTGAAASAPPAPPPPAAPIKHHEFSVVSLTQAKSCYACGQKIWGFSKQASQCSVCSIVIHHKCVRRMVDEVSSRVRDGCKRDHDGDRGRAHTHRDESPLAVLKAQKSASSHGLSHLWIPKTLDSPYFCDFCRKFIWGLGRFGLGVTGPQASTCTRCNMIIHQHCEAEVTWDCVEDAESERDRLSLDATGAGAGQAGLGVVAPVSISVEVTPADTDAEAVNGDGESSGSRGLLLPDGIDGDGDDGPDSTRTTHSATPAASMLESEAVSIGMDGGEQKPFPLETGLVPAPHERVLYISDDVLYAPEEGVYNRIDPPVEGSFYYGTFVVTNFRIWFHCIVQEDTRPDSVEADGEMARGRAYAVRQGEEKKDKGIGAMIWVVSEVLSSSVGVNEGGHAQGDPNANPNAKRCHVFPETVVPLACIMSVQKAGAKQRFSKEQRLIQIGCKDGRPSLKLACPPRTHVRRYLLHLLTSRAFVGDGERMFAFVRGHTQLQMPEPVEEPKPELDEHATPAQRQMSRLVTDREPINRVIAVPKPGAVIDGWMCTLIEQDIWRVLVRSVRGPSLWRMTDSNASYRISPSYPKHLFVPQSVSDITVSESAQFRSKGRLPSLVWLSRDGVALCRCSQPRTGLQGKRSAGDEYLLAAMAKAGPPPRKIVIYDARPLLNASVNALKGAGYENESHYDLCSIAFLGIENIHVMRDSFWSMISLLQSQENRGFLSALESTGWLLHVHCVLAGSKRVVETMVRDKVSVVLHCSDGWDRTPQLTSLVQIQQDPFYSTMFGFAVLIEKEWVAFGHKFHDRLGHGSPPTQEWSPIFIQFIDCVWQIMEQNPRVFEFNEAFLLALCDSVYSGEWGTFMYKCNRERDGVCLKERTESVWTWLLGPDVRNRFTNSLYVPGGVFDLQLDPSIRSLRLWLSYYNRFAYRPRGD